MSILWKGSFGLHVFYNSGMAGDVDTCKSTSAYALTLDDGVVLWCSRLQRIVASLTIEAHYNLATEVSKKVTWFAHLCYDLGLPKSTGILHCDS